MCMHKIVDVDFYPVLLSLAKTFYGHIKTLYPRIYRLFAEKIH